ncbi:gephyrin-like molybdotransferase receptor GlpR [Rhodococcus sp. NPDC060090]|uniref:divisome protein SepX/GlpR n=1 Tax=Rhodococcus sp. NPDC060090 TaxID=3347056 RepID=UPI0036492EB3
MPNSLLWIGLVAVWLFVLVPMLVTKRPRIRQTTDAALATRVLHRGDQKPKAPRGPAAGHRTDPNWRPSRDHTHRHAEARMNTQTDDRLDTELELSDLDGAAPENSDEYQYEVDGPPARQSVPRRRGRGGFDPQADAVASAERYDFRQRAVLGLLIGAIMTAALAMILSSAMWWVCGLVTAGLVGYLFYLRRQVRLEQDIRRRRMARLQRSAATGVHVRGDGDHGEVPSRLRRPGAVVLELDDEDPEFEHLDRFDDEYEYPGYGDPDYVDPGYDEPDDFPVRHASGA